MDTVLTNELIREERNVLDGQWGTIGPNMMRAGSELAALTGTGYGLVCHSFDAAYEAALRIFAKGPGAVVLMPSLCAPSDALVADALGFEVVFCKTGANLIRTLEALCPAVCVLDADGADSPETWSKACRRAGVPLILNGGRTLRRKTPLSALADVAVYDLGAGSEVDAMGGGLVVTDSADDYAVAFAVHNCGRPCGAGATLTFDDFVGGDLRVSEWTAGAALVILKTGAFGTPDGYAAVDMASQPLFRDRARVLD